MKLSKNRFFQALMISTPLIFGSCALGDSLVAEFKNIGNEFLEDTGIGTVVESISKLAEDISTEDAYYIGRTVAANILTNYNVVNDREMEIYLNKICQALVINSDDPLLYNGYHVKILDTSEVNAFSTPGGHILITRGLINCTQSEDALAAVIAHEIAHIQLKHSLSSIKASRFRDTLNAFGSLFDDEEMENVSDDIMSNMMGSGFSQGQEYDADEEALKLMAMAGYNPRAMEDMLTLMKDHEKVAGKSGFFKTHPSPSSRMYNLKNLYKQYKVDDTMDARVKRYTEVMD